MKTILSNRKWFNEYCIFRTSCVLGTILLFIIYGLNWQDCQDWWGTESIFSILIAVLVVILLFDFFQKPAFIELTSNGKEIIINQYEPDRRYLYFLKEKATHQFKISSPDKLTFDIQKGSIVLFDKIIFYTKEVKSLPINCAWLNAEQLNFLKAQLKTFNKQR